MKFIYDQLGDWYLAMAAYDYGAGNIQREVQKTGYADFWELYKRNELPARDDELRARNSGRHHRRQPPRPVRL